MPVRFPCCLNEKEFNLFGTRQRRTRRLLITFNEYFFPSRAYLGWVCFRPVPWAVRELPTLPVPAVGQVGVWVPLGPTCGFCSPCSAAQPGQVGSVLPGTASGVGRDGTGWDGMGACRACCRHWAPRQGSIGASQSSAVRTHCHPLVGSRGTTPKCLQPNHDQMAAVGWAGCAGEHLAQGSGCRAPVCVCMVGFFFFLMRSRVVINWLMIDWA